MDVDQYNWKVTRRTGLFFRRQFDERFFIDDSKKIETPPLRFRVHQFLFAGRRKFVTEGIHTLLNVLWCAMYVLETYYPSGETPHWAIAVDYALASILFLIFLIHLYTSPNRKRFLLSMNTFVDLVTIIPGFLSVQLLPQIRFIAILRIFRVSRFVSIMSNQRWKSGTRIVSTLFSFIFIVTSIFLIFESESLINFHRTLYFVIVTISTVGYGDYSAQTEIGRILVMLTIVTAIILIPVLGYHFSRLLFTTEDMYMGTFKRSKHRHILLIGRNLNVKKVQDFLEELFIKYKSPNNPTLNVVILQPESPSPELELLWSHSDSEVLQNVFFYRGNPLNYHDLYRVNAQNAQVIVLYGNGQKDGNEADRELIYYNLAVKAFCNHVPTFVFLSRPENESALLSSCLREGNYEADEILHQNKGIFIIPKFELKMAIIANSVKCKGFCTLINNLLRTELSDIYKLTLHDSEHEYQRGSDHEIYCGSLKNFANTPFNDAVKSVFKDHNAILIGVLIEKTVVLNPEDYTLHGNELGFFLAINSTIPVTINDFRGNNVNTNNPIIGNRRRMALKSGVNKFVEKTRIEMERSDVLSEFSFLKYVQKKIEILSVDYYTLDTPITTKPYIEDASHMKDHIIIYGYMKDFHLLVGPLRSKANHSFEDILIVTRDPISDQEWEDIFLFPNIYLMLGQFTYRHDMVRASVQSAHHVIISFNYSLHKMSEEKQMQETILTYLCLQNYYPKTQVTVDIPDEDTLRLFHTKSALDNMLYKEVMAGLVYPRTLMDRLMAHGVCNPYIIDVIMGMSFWHIRNEDGKEYLDQTITLQEIPRKYHDKSFLKVFKHFLRKNKICIGIYRSKFNRQIMEREEYVYTCPHSESIVTKDDRVYILTSMSVT